MTDTDALKRFWELANELTTRHDANNELTADIFKQIADLKQRTEGKSQDQEQGFLSAIDSSTTDAQPLNQFEVDNATATLGSQYNTLLQKYQRTISRNQQLEKDCGELQALVQEYESNLSKVAEKLRTHTVSTTEGYIRLRKEYEALLDAEKGTTAELMIENMTLRQHLHQIASMLRTAYDSPEGDEHAAQFAQLTIENQGLREMLQISQVSKTGDSTASTDPAAPVSIKQEQHADDYRTYFY
ncbi:hypothetical protein BDB00DRAFT_869459 [Zychaea mexicana]|uniref:uncharacterized protein n=1 Tax=Zychaea mexicana TaxID=64656 RepID=UPI0022FDEB24|nr:uncharacterized protein BDB00DRAFT_869459 [Zychaea mexicana]KAI9496527.1 hypothetical protein BDB00DRAFT_869459 [Zychaea mexicana]